MDLLAASHRREAELVDRLVQELRLLLLARPAAAPAARLAQLVTRTVALLQADNQYLELTAAARTQLARLLLPWLAADAPDDGLEGLREPLRAFLRQLAQDNAGPEFAFSAQLCAEYSPELQLQLLGVTPAALREPILDLGCGAAARLVVHLRGLGLDARGVDRQVTSGPGRYAGDWFSFPLEPACWGTIVSHLAFSSHFHHHHHRPGGHPARYARRTLELLEALQVGGRLILAPGLPFFEPLLPADRYGVVQRPFALPPDSALCQALQARFGDGLLYASHISRRAPGQGEVEVPGAEGEKRSLRPRG